MDQDTKSVSVSSTDGEPKIEDDETKVPNAPLHHILNATIYKVNGSIITCLTDKINIFDGDFDLNQVEHDFVPYNGDRIKVIVSAEPPYKVLAIEPDGELKSHIGKITHLTKSFAIVDDDIIYYIPDEMVDFPFKKNDEVECVVIEDGEYECGKTTKYEQRCERMHKVERVSDEIKKWFNEPTLDTMEEANSDSDTENSSEPQMQFEALKGKAPNEEYYDLPMWLYELLKANDNPQKVNRKLKQYVPAELNYKTYKRRFHAHVYLEEVEMRLSFEKYHSRELWIEPENKRFSILCHKITELRPPIAVGDRIIVKKHSNPSHYYRGTVERVLPNRFILKFRPDFVQDFRLGEPFEAQFFHNRVVFQRKHAAIDYTKQKFNEPFLFPKSLTTANDLQLNAEIRDGKLHLNGNEAPWHKDLNEEQKEAVAVALRGECRPLPLIIFGPAGTGKTSTLIEIILQIYANMPNCKILIATQSNHAANVVASRLIQHNEEIGSDMLRLVSNALLDRKSLPKDLHKFSASILHSNAELVEQDDDVNYDDIPKDVKRNCRLQYLKNFKIIVGTCVGMGILFNSEFSDKYFTHVFIDEAAQCSECEAMIPITSINPDGGQIILAGDPLQLPPISLSNHAKHYDLVKSMLQRYLDMYETMDNTVPAKDGGYDSRLVVKLRRNYRSIPSILNYYNEQFYDSTLIPTICGSTSKEALKLKDLGRFLKHCDGDEPFGITFVNVENGRNERLESKKSWENKEEVAMIKSFIAKLLQYNIVQEDIGVITGYHAQVLALRKSLKTWKKIRIGTVEEFQGEEKMIIIFSAVKTSGLEKALQFIFCPKRLNTAVTRARMMVAIFGKGSLLSNDPKWNKLIEYCDVNNAVIDGKDIIQIL